MSFSFRAFPLRTAAAVIAFSLGLLPALSQQTKAHPKARIRQSIPSTSPSSSRSRWASPPSASKICTRSCRAPIDKKTLAGAVTILARHGKIVDYRTYGYKDIAAGAPMTKDAIFRDFSMTKPVTGVAMMILYEQGKWLPSDPISKYIPEFANLKVYKGVGANGQIRFSPIRITRPPCASS